MRSRHASIGAALPDAPRGARPLRLLVTLLGGALVVLIALVSSAAPGVVPERPRGQGLLAARADTDSVAVDRQPATEALVADTAFLPDTARAAFYLPPRRPDRRTASPFQRKMRPLSARLGSYWKHEITLDSTGRYYVARESVGDRDVRYPLRLDLDAYRQVRMREDMASSWRTLIDEHARQRQQQRRGGLGLNIMVPGGRQSAFSTIFGKPEVDLRVTGQAYIQAGFDYRKSDQQVAFTGRAARTDPTFKQDLSLGITGSIGDKLTVDVSWDTGNQFDYQNQLKLQYQGYEDEIIQRIEAGNVFLQTPSSLIRGGQSLFGIKSELQIGGVRLTTVASQQEGQSNNLSIEGGSETQAFDLRPTDYDERTHFFLSYYFRNRWEDAYQEPPNLVVYDGFERITDIEVWRLQQRSVEEQDVRSVVALVDLGEPVEILTQAETFTTPVLPSFDVHQYTEAEVDEQLRKSTTPKDFLTARQLDATDWQSGRFKRLERGREYDVDEVLGYISLRQRLQDNEALAVAFRYRREGRIVTVGDFSGETGGALGGQNDERLVLKLLRPVNLTPPSPESKPPAWYLEMRNIYRLRSYGLNLSDFELQVFYEPPGKVADKTLPGVGGRQTLLQLLGLDRLNEDGALTPDNQFDKLVNYTIDPGRGLLIFPYLEPFGRRIGDVLESASPEQQNLLVFSNLYTEKPEQARRDTQRDVYRIRGSYKGAVQSFYDLGAYAGLIEGSVKVTSGGTPLQEGLDYTVDYQGGTVTIINPSYLTPGRNIDISYEQNQFINFQKKTLLGARAEYSFDNRLDLGATVMRLSQKSPVDKFRLGEEPISNTIWGVDGRVDLEPRWLTRAIDALPFLQTKAPSAISLSGEFAQLRPSHVETIAFERTRRELRKAGRDFNDDELSGVSYVDDFEGFETTYSLKQPGAWALSAAPDSIGGINLNTGMPLTQQGAYYDSLRTTWRGTLGWYTPNQNTLRELGAPEGDPATKVVFIQEVFPNRDTRGEGIGTLSTLDLHFDPHDRGPYNYTTELLEFLRNPKYTWGGITQRLPEGYNDFNLKNIEFVEFVFRPFAENAANDAGADAKLYVDLGFISEDIIPDEALNTEDGLSTTQPSASNITKWARLPSGLQNNAIDVDERTGLTEDLGLDGLASYPGSADLYGPATEQNAFRHFLDALPDCALAPDPQHCEAQAAKAHLDPAADDFHYFSNDQYFNPTFFPPDGPSIQQRFSRFFPGTELNSFEAQNKLATNTSVRRGNSRYPDSEDLNLNSTVDTDNSYFQYEVPLSRQVLAEQALETNVNDYVVTEITDQNGTGTGWYQVRIPVRNWTRRVGGINDFTSIESIRIWTTGHAAPATVRFATFELVGSQWQKAPQVAEERVEELRAQGIVMADTTAQLTISSINNEENPNIYKPPAGAVISQLRLANGQAQNAREQAMVLRVENLRPGQQRAIYKPFQGYDFLKYNHLRMFVHMHGRLAGPPSGQSETDLARLAEANPALARSKARIFIRLGANTTNDYYEYEQPLTPSLETAGDRDILWQTYALYNGEYLDLGSVSLDLGALNELKVARDEQAFRTDSLFWNADENGNLIEGRPRSDFAPPGTRIGIKGTPSLSRISTIVIGIRNPADPNSQLDEDVLEDVTVWVNELRTAGYDAKPGVAGLFNADIRLADLGRVKANFSAQTDGFGSLASTLDDRDQTSLRNWGILTDVNLDKFIPERYGWSLPVSVQLQSNTSTPRYSPNQGDVRLENILNLIEDRTDLSPEEKELQKQEAIEAAQTYSFSRSFTARVQKTGSDSRLLRNTLDGISLSYSYSDADGRSPSLRLNDSWRWSGTASYRLSVRRPRTVRPFWFLDDLPVIGLLGDLQFNYVPQNVTLSGTASRLFSRSQDRAQALRLQAPGALLPPDLVSFPLREQQSFTHRRNFGLQYNPFGFLNLSFDTNTDQSLNALGADTLYSVLLYDELSGDYRAFEGYTLEDALAGTLPGGIQVDESEIDSTAFEVSRLQVQPTGRVLNTIFNGVDPRTERYGQRFNASFQPNLNQLKALDWITIQPITYGVTFSWQDGAVGRNTGASIGNQVDIRGGLSLQPQNFWRKFGFYQKLEEAQRQAEQEAQAERQRREQERQRRREEARAERERRQQEAAADPDEQAAPPEEDTLPEEDTPLEDPPLEEDAPPEQDVPPEEDTSLEEDTLPEEDQAQPEEQPSGDGLRLPVPDPLALLRQTALAVTGMREFRVTYNGSRSANATNVGHRAGSGEAEVYHSLLDALRGNGPSLGYRFGLDRRIDADQRILDDRLQVTDVLSDANRIQAQTTLNPTRNLQVNLNWNTDWNSGENITYRPLADEITGLPLYDEFGNVLIEMTPTRNGTNKSSVWAFGASYLDLFQRQLDAYLADYSGNPGQVVDDEAGNRDGRVVLTNESIVEDFRGAFLSSGFGTLDGRNLLPFPMPTWSVSYAGLTNWPLIRRLVQSATLRHGYSADYSADFRTNLAALDGAFGTIDLGGGIDRRTIRFAIPSYEVNTVRINERYQPLVGLDLAWKGRLQTNIAWNKSNSYVLGTTNNEVGELKTSEITMTASYQQQGLRLPFLPGKRLNNRISFSLTLSLSETNDQRYSLRRALEAAILSPDPAGFPLENATIVGENVSVLTSTQRFSVAPKISYQFSNRVSSDFVLRYERFQGDSRQPSFTTVTGNFNVRVSISN